MLFVNMILADYSKLIPFICNDIKLDDVVRFKCHCPAVLIVRPSRSSSSCRSTIVGLFSKTPSSTVFSLEDHLLVQFELQILVELDSF